MCVYCVYLLCIYINTHSCMYTFHKNMLCLYFKFIYNINYINTNIDNIFKIYTVCMCIYIYIIHLHRRHTYIKQTKTVIFCMRLIVWQHYFKFSYFYLSVFKKYAKIQRGTMQQLKTHLHLYIWPTIYKSQIECKNKSFVNCLRLIDKLDVKNRFPWTVDLMFKWLVHPKMKLACVLLALRGVYDFLLSDVSIRSYIKIWSKFDSRLKIHCRSRPHSLHPILSCLHSSLLSNKRHNIPPLPQNKYIKNK